MNISKARGIIILLSFFALFFSLAIENKLVALVLMVLCVLGSIFVLYRYLDELTDFSGDDSKRKYVKIVTVFNIAIFVCAVILSVLIGTGVVNLGDDGRYFAAIIVAVVILFVGIISPKLPFSKHTGLRLPWTVTDETAWVVAHKILGYISIPLAVVYIAGVAVINNFEMWTFVVIVLWILIPGVFSLWVHKKQNFKSQ